MGTSDRLIKKSKYKNTRKNRYKVVGTRCYIFPKAIKILMNEIRPWEDDATFPSYRVRN